MTVPAFRARKGSGKPLVVLTAYDAMTTAAAEAAGVDALLVGDSLGLVELGYDSTLPVTMDDMLHHAKAVSRRRQQALLIVDMPWLLQPDHPPNSMGGIGDSPASVARACVAARLHAGARDYSAAASVGCASDMDSAHRPSSR